MFVPPFEIIDFYKVNSLSEKKSVYFLCEGQNSEKYFIRHLITQTPTGLILKNKYILKEIKKTGKESGLTHPISLVQYALDWASNKDNNFDPSNSAIIVFFDTDVLSAKDIQTLLSMKTDYIEYAFTNPKFEVFQLMSVLDDLSEIESKYMANPLGNKVLENEFSSRSHINSKNKNSGKFVADKIDKILANDKYDESDILLSKNRFCTSVSLILNDLLKK